MTGRGTGKFASKKLELAMAVRSINAHYQLDEVQRRHWNEMARRCRLGLDAEDWIAELIAHTPAVIAEILGHLPTDFPDEVARPILDGQVKSSRRLAAMPA